MTRPSVREEIGGTAHSPAAEAVREVLRRQHLQHINTSRTFSSSSNSSSDNMTTTSRESSPSRDSSTRRARAGRGTSNGDQRTESTLAASAMARPIDSNGDSNGGANSGEYFAEPEWQRAPGRWSKREESLLREMKALLEDDLRAAPPFPEVVGSRRMLRFLRGHRHNAQEAAAMMRKMLKWRQENGVNDIREDIMLNRKFHPSQFPDGEMITKLYPLLVVNPLCVDLDGAPISYESYAFSPRQVTAHANGDLSFFIRFHIYCQEFKQICLDSLSDAKEMANLAERAAQAASPSPTASDNKAVVASTSANGDGHDAALANGATGRGGSGGHIPSRSPSDDRRASSGLKQESSGPEGNGRGRSKKARGRASAGESEAREGEGSNDGGDVSAEAGEKPWGVLLRNTIIRDLAGFGMEHAGPIGRSLISKVMAVSQDNYPEMMERCYIINAPWVFFALWKGLAPLMSVNTAKKVQVLNYDFLPTLRKKIAMERLPSSAGGHCEPDAVTPEQMQDFVVCGRVADTSDGEGVADDGGDMAQTRYKDEDDRRVDAGQSEQEYEDSEDGRAAGRASGDDAGRRRGTEHRRNGNDADERHRRRGGPFKGLFERRHGRSRKGVAEERPVGRRVSSPPGAGSPLMGPAVSLHGSARGEIHRVLSGGGGGNGAADDQALLHLSERRYTDPRSSPGRNRPFASPGPRGVRRASSGVDSGSAAGGEGGGHSVANDDGSVGYPTEDFDSRLVDQALELSMSRKARRLSKTFEGLSGSGSSASPSEQSFDGREKDLKDMNGGGWVRKTWRVMRERRESRKRLEKDVLGEFAGVAISAGDCAEWVPNSERDSCLHCERLFTLLLRRHHCRMCGELVCGQCSPHRVRLDLGVGSGGGANDNNGSGGGVDVRTEGGEESSQREGGTPRHSKRRRRHQKAVAVRVCTDCHFSLQTVTVASSTTLQDMGVGAAGGDAGGVYAGTLGLNGIRSGAIDEYGGGWGFVEDTEAVFEAVEIEGDVVLEDVLEWGRIQRRAGVAWSVVRMCLLTVTEMHHKQLVAMMSPLLRVLSNGTLPSMGLAATLVASANSRDGTSSPPSSMTDDREDGRTQPIVGRRQQQQLEERRAVGSAGRSCPGSPLSRSTSGDRRSQMAYDSSEEVTVDATIPYADPEAAIWAALDAMARYTSSTTVVFVAVVSWLVGLWWFVSR